MTRTGQISRWSSIKRNLISAVPRRWPQPFLKCRARSAADRSRDEAGKSPPPGPKRDAGPTPVEFFRKVTPSLAHSTPFRSRRSLAKVSTNSREPHIPPPSPGTLQPPRGYDAAVLRQQRRLQGILQPDHQGVARRI